LPPLQAHRDTGQGGDASKHKLKLKAAARVRDTSVGLRTSCDSAIRSLEPWSLGLRQSRPAVCDCRAEAAFGNEVSRVQEVDAVGRAHTDQSPPRGQLGNRPGIGEERTAGDCHRAEL